MSRWTLAIDFGTSFTTAATWRDGQLGLVEVGGSQSSQFRMPSAVWVDDTGGLVVGWQAETQSPLAPERLERAPKQLLGDAPPMQLGRLVPVEEAVAAVLRAVMVEARRQAGGSAPGRVVLTHPASWPERRKASLRDAARQAGIEDAHLLPEPVGAAVYFTGPGANGGGSVEAGASVAVYDLGGGTFDTAVLRRTDASGFEPIGVGGRDGLGGEVFDTRLSRHVRKLLLEEAPKDWYAIERSPRALQAFRREVRTAKEALSVQGACDVILPEVTERAAIRVTRGELEGLLEDDVDETVEILVRTCEQAGVRPADLHGVFLVGGSSRIPLVADRMARELGRVPDTRDNPKAVVALGAAAIAAGEMTTEPRSLVVVPEKQSPEPPKAVRSAAVAPPPPATEASPPKQVRPPKRERPPEREAPAPRQDAKPSKAERTRERPQKPPRDRPRERRRAPEPAPAPQTTASAVARPAPSRRVWLAAAAAVVVLAAVAFVVGQSGGSDGGEAATSAVSAGRLELTVPDGWKRMRDAPEIPGLAFSGNPIAVAAPGTGTDSRVVAGQTDATGAALLPAAFLKRLGEAPPRDDAVRLGRLEAYRYRNLEAKGYPGKLDMYVAPTTTGIVTIACVSPGRARQFVSDCEGVAGTARLAEGKPLPLGPDEAYGKQIEAVIGKLDAARRPARRQLRTAVKASGQAEASSRLARAYAAARRGTESASPGPVERATHEAIVRALRRAEAAYGRLASAARREQPSRYSAAVEDVRTAESALEKSLAELRAEA